MNLLQIGIASIVDSNTGYGLPHPAGRIDYTAAETRAQQIRSKTLTILAQRISDRIAQAMQALSGNREHRRGLQQLADLDDHMLDDVGFSRGDISAAQAGQIDLGQLAMRRRESPAGNRLQLQKLEITSQNPVTDSAINEALYTRENCA
jgi:uncharacterized protein YjiS (DUF1127 family)